jgi:hypothetical protein
MTQASVGAAGAMPGRGGRPTWVPTPMGQSHGLSYDPDRCGLESTLQNPLPGTQQPMRRTIVT